MELPDLLEVITEVAGALQLPIALDDSLQRITAGAVDAIPGIDYVSISVTGNVGAISTLAPTDQLAIAADELQYQLSQSPCVQAALSDPVVQVDDLATDPRWPQYGPAAAAKLGIGSQLSLQFHAQPHARGALNLYATQVHAIGVDTLMVGAMFARLVAIALNWGRQNDSMNEALASRQDIGQAVGILMERYRLDPDRAFQFLVRTSQDSNTKLRAVAAGIITDTTHRAD